MDPILLGMIKKASSPTDEQVASAINTAIANGTLQAYDDTDINEHISGLESIIGVSYSPSGAGNKEDLWEKGGIHSSETTNLDDDTNKKARIRTKTYLSSSVTAVSIPTGYALGIAVFAPDGSSKKWLKNDGYLSSTEKYLTPTELQTYNLSTAYSVGGESYTQIRLVLQKADLSEIQLSEYSSVTFTVASSSTTSLQDQITELFQSVSNGKSLIASAITDKGVTTSNEATFSTMASNISSITQGRSPLYTFGVVSDCHVRAAYEADQKFSALLETYAGTDVDFICTCGDMSTDGLEEFQNVRTLINASSFTKPVYMIRGNHDISITDADWQTYSLYAPNFSFQHEGDYFVFLSLDYNSLSYNAAIEYLNSLDTGDSRVFLFMHFPYYGMAGTKTGEAYGFDSANEQQWTIYNKFSKNLITFNGHTHYLFSVEDDLAKYDFNVYTDEHNKTTVHCPSTGYAHDKDRKVATVNGYATYNQGWIVEVYAKSVILKAINLADGTFMQDYEYHINFVK